MSRPKHKRTLWERLTQSSKPAYRGRHRYEPEPEQRHYDAVVQAFADVAAAWPIDVVVYDANEPEPECYPEDADGTCIICKPPVEPVLTGEKHLTVDEVRSLIDDEPPVSLREWAGTWPPPVQCLHRIPQALPGENDRCVKREMHRGDHRTSDNVVWPYDQEDYLADQEARALENEGFATLFRDVMATPPPLMVLPQERLAVVPDAFPEMPDHVVGRHRKEPSLAARVPGQTLAREAGAFWTRG